MFFPLLHFFSESARHEESDIERILARDRDPEGSATADERQDRVGAMDDLICVLSSNEICQLSLPMHVYQKRFLKNQKKTLRVRSYLLSLYTYIYI